MTIEACLNGIYAQEWKGDLEVIVIDSGSTDSTVATVSDFPVALHKIPPERFNHGQTRNLGVELAQGDFVVLTVADATPKDSNWISRMLSHFADPTVMAVVGQQIVPPSKWINPLERYRPTSEPQARRVSFARPEEFFRLTSQEKNKLCGVDNVTAMYRRSALLQLPFPPVMYGEDMAWAREAIGRGWTIVFDPLAQVYHYHEQTFAFAFQRSYIEQHYLWKLFKTARPIRPLFRSLALNIYRLAKEDCSLKEKLEWLVYNQKATVAGWVGTRIAYFFSRHCSETTAEKAREFFCRRPPTPTLAKPLVSLHETNG